MVRTYLYYVLSLDGEGVVYFMDWTDISRTITECNTVEPLYNGHFGIRYFWPLFAAM